MNLEGSVELKVTGSKLEKGLLLHKRVFEAAD